MGQRNLMALAALMGGLQAPLAFGQILPDNSLYLQDCLECETGLSKEDFMGVIDEVRTVYEGIVESQGGKLEIEARWSDSTVNASAIQMYGTWTVNMYGGLARRPEITKDGFTLVLCHELGHHLGGFPFVSSWGSNEGESDYFATHSCAFQLWKDEKEVNAEARQSIAQPAKEQCDVIYSDKDEQNLCYRIVMGGKSLGNLLGALKRQTVSFEKRDTKQVRRTEHGHPDAQCRLDTYVAGAVCTVPHDMDVIPGKRDGRGYNDRTSEMEAARHSCHSVNGDSAGLRPRCWFKPGV